MAINSNRSAAATDESAKKDRKERNEHNDDSAAVGPVSATATSERRRSGWSESPNSSMPAPSISSKSPTKLKTFSRSHSFEGVPPHCQVDPGILLLLNVNKMSVHVLKLCKLFALQSLGDSVNPPTKHVRRGSQLAIGVRMRSLCVIFLLHK